VHDWAEANQHLGRPASFDRPVDPVAEPDVNRCLVEIARGDGKHGFDGIVSRDLEAVTVEREELLDELG
jgi:hypothetical protein